MQYTVTMEQKRTKRVEISADNQRQAKARALELLADGALDDGLALPPDFDLKTKVVKIGRA